MSLGTKRNASVFQNTTASAEETGNQPSAVPELTNEIGNSTESVAERFANLQFGPDEDILNPANEPNTPAVRENRALRAHGLFFTPETEGKDFSTVLAQVQEYISEHYSTLITGDSEDANASEIYYRVLYGRPAPTYGQEFDEWSDGLPLSDAPFIGADGFCSPLGEGWRSMVTSEFGYRKDPFTGQTKGHSGLDLGAGKGTSIRAALPGTVYVVRYSTSGYGYHVMVDHGGGFVTLYAHCSKILVTEGQTVDAGTVIAEVGSTGRSTGNHLHFEVRINGEKQNPRSYLP